MASIPIVTFAQLTGDTTTTQNISGMMTYFLPLLFISFAVIVVIAVLVLMVRLFTWIGHGIANLVNPHKSPTYGDTDFDEIRRMHDMFPRT